MLVIDVPRDDGGHKKRVLVLGTCRLTDPILSLSDEQRCNVVWSHTGFTHTVEDVIQMISFIKGEINIPEENWPLIFGEGVVDLNSGVNSIDCAREIISGIDSIIIEINTRSRVHTAEYEFQPDYLESFFRPAGLDFLDWWSAVGLGKDSREDENAKFVEGICGLNLMSEGAALEIANNCTRSIDSVQEIKKQISKLREMVKVEILFSTNADPRNTNFYSALAEIVDDLEGVRHFDQISFVSSFDNKMVFKEEGKDYNHFTDLFNPIIGKEICRFILSEEVTNRRKVVVGDFVFSSVLGEASLLSGKLANNVSFFAKDGVPPEIWLQGRTFAPDEEFSEGWFELVFEIDEELLTSLEGLSVVVLPQNEKMPITLDGGGAGIAAFSALMWLNRTEEFEIMVKFELGSIVTENFEIQNICLIPQKDLNESFLPLGRIHSPGIILRNTRKRSNNKSSIEVELTEKHDSTGGIFLHDGKTDLLNENQVEISLSARIISGQGEDGKLGYFNGKTWSFYSEKLGKETLEISIIEEVHLSQQKPRIGFWGFSPRVKILLEKMEVNMHYLEGLE